MTGIPPQDDYVPLNFDHSKKWRPPSKNAGWEVDRAWRSIKDDLDFAEKWFRNKKHHKKEAAWMQGFTY